VYLCYVTDVVSVCNICRFDLSCNIEEYMDWSVVFGDIEGLCVCVCVSVWIWLSFHFSLYLQPRINCLLWERMLM
jgi:hypothetical protein